MSVSINYNGLKVDEIIALAELGDLGNTAEEINQVFPGRATEIEEAEAEPDLAIEVALMFSVTSETDLDALLAKINAILEEDDLPGDAEWVELLTGDDETSE
jgi:hypothetical protein